MIGGSFPFRKNHHRSWARQHFFFLLHKVPLLYMCNQIFKHEWCIFSCLVLKKKKIILSLFFLQMIYVMNGGESPREVLNSEVYFINNITSCSRSIFTCRIRRARRLGVNSLKGAAATRSRSSIINQDQFFNIGIRFGCNITRFLYLHFFYLFEIFYVLSVSFFKSNTCCSL